MNYIYKDGLKYYQYDKQPSYHIDNYYPEQDVIIQLIKLSKAIELINYDKYYKDLLVRQINNHLCNYFPKKYDYMKEINNKHILIHYIINDNKIEYKKFKNIEELKKYLIKNEEFIRDHINYKLELKYSITNNDSQFINKINEFIINDNKYDINELLKYDPSNIF